MAFPVTLNGRTYTLADFSGTNYVDGFPDALEDFVTQAGNIYTTTSTSSVAIGTGSKTFTVADSGKPYTVGTPLRIADAAAPATNWIDAIVTSYSGTTLVVNAVAYAGSGTISSWNINIGGSAVAYTGTLPVAQGGTGATTEAAARTNLDVYSKSEADSLFLTEVNTSELVEKTSATGSAEIPAGTDAQRDGTPSAGYFRFNTDSSSFEGYDGTAWGAVGGSADLSAVAEDILPDADSTRDIGSTSARWAQGWFDSVTAGTADINGGTIDGTVIGGTTPAAISGTTATFSGAVTGTDLTLSGGVYLGGTGAANYLDDYEEGTFTATLSPSSGFTPSSNTVTAYYTKTGRVVTISATVSMAVPASLGSYANDNVNYHIEVSGLPFTIMNDVQARSAPTLGVRGTIGTTNGELTGHGEENGTRVFIYQSKDSGSTRTSPNLTVSTVASLHICYTYFTTT